MIDYNEKKQFYDEYIDGRKDYYFMSYGELLNTFGEEWANKIWVQGYIPKEYYNFAGGTEEDSTLDQEDGIFDYTNIEDVISSYLFDD